MPDKKLSKIAIRPINNAAAIASTLGITTIPKVKELSENEANSRSSRNDSELPIQADSPQKQKTEKDPQDKPKIKALKTVTQESRGDGKISDKNPEPKNEISLPISIKKAEMPLMIEIKRKFPGKELFVLSLLYLNRNNRGFLQMTVNGIMALYSVAFQDVIKDDTVRRSLKRLSDSGLIRTTSIPGNNSGYIYEIGNLLDDENLTDFEKEEFGELTDYVRSRIASQNA